MATVTKLKAEITNINLPILGDDGNIYNYYVGKYTNKMLELGVSLTTDETSALNVFIENGINNGWIDKVMYFMPFIGRETKPLSGLVPLIDKVGGDYTPSVDTVASKNFLYSNGKIIGLGDNVNDVDKIDLPVNPNLVDKSSGFYFNLTKRVTNFSTGYILTRYGEVTLQGIRFNLQHPDEGFQFYRYYDSSELLGGVVINLNLGEQIGLLHGYYTKQDGLQTFKKYAILKNAIAPFDTNMRAVESLPYDSGGTICLSGRLYQGYFKNTVNVAALFNLEELTSNDMYFFNQAVFTLTTALGK